LNILFLREENFSRIFQGLSPSANKKLLLKEEFLRVGQGLLAESRVQNVICRRSRKILVWFGYKILSGELAKKKDVARRKQNPRFFSCFKRTKESNAFLKNNNYS